MCFRSMIANGEWNKNNNTNYISCDAYNGENTPKRFGLKLKNALELVSMLVYTVFLP